ncbi:hypothetical protein EI613_17860 [Azospirillum sp. 412522]|nr:hypothetical protein [Azospirillum sp. 412522]MBY6263766.1 hypothetical protein [Azospirillum sp. 412522]
MNSNAIHLSESQQEERRPVWEALAAMYLDTDVSLSRAWRVQVLSASPYSLEEIDAILRDEVHPVCFWNLLQPAGEWAGFDPIRLEQAIRGHRNRWHSRLLTMVCRAMPSCFPKDEWMVTRQEIASLRGRRGASRP